MAFSLFKRPLKSLAVIVPHATGAEQAPFLARLIATHVGNAAGPLTDLPVGAVVYFTVKEDPDAPPLNGPVLDEKSAIGYAEVIQKESALWGEIDVGERLRISLRISPPPRTGEPVEYRAEVPLAELGSLLDGILAWIGRVAGKGDQPVIPSVREMPTEILEDVFRAREGMVLMAVQGTPPEERLLARGRACIDILRRKGRIDFVWDELCSMCAEAEGEACNRAAFQLLEETREVLPDEPVVLGMRAIMIERLAAGPAEALPFWRESVERFPQYYQGWTRIARILFEGMKDDPSKRTPENTRATIEALQTTLSLCETQAFAHLLLGNLLKDNEDERRRHWQRALELDGEGENGRMARQLLEGNPSLGVTPDQVMGWFQEGTALLEKGSFAEALALYEKITQYGPQVAGAYGIEGEMYNGLFVPVWLNKGVCLAKLGRPTEALRCWDQVLQLDPGNERALTFREKLQEG